MVSSLVPKVTVPEGQRGPWRVYRRTIENDLRRIRLVFDGRSPGEPGDVITILAHDKRGIVMSDTDAERHDHRPWAWACRQKGGDVLINGLGLGMAVATALACDKVASITVIEIDPDVIALTGPHYAADPRVTIINADAYEWQPPKGSRYGAAWHDIWDDICIDNLPEMAKLHRKYGRRVDWQGSWGKWQAESERRRA